MGDLPGEHSGESRMLHESDGLVNKGECLLCEDLHIGCAQVYVAFASHFTEPGHRSLSPLALGLTVWVMGEAGGLYTGAAVNPARVIAASLVFLCTPQRCPPDPLPPPWCSCARPRGPTPPSHLRSCGRIFCAQASRAATPGPLWYSTLTPCMGLHDAFGNDKLRGFAWFCVGNNASSLQKLCTLNCADTCKEAR